jgi:hypothetical protein
MRAVDFPLEIQMYANLIYYPAGLLILYSSSQLII